MSYLVLARKYRPKNFDDMAGQEAVAATLKNSIKLGRIAHAYLLTGPRGVGKTSVARIFAKALNCVDGPTPDPCGVCPSCKDIDASRALDVIEIDGASNRGIDDIRAVRDNIRFSPVTGKYKIYIIDEVHQVTDPAFNALLKTLEEPPAHAMFIFATTEPQSIPATILSRCQRFDFKRITTPKIIEVLTAIAKKEKFKIDADALFEIAKAADGSLRDAQSLLDQVAASTQGTITADIAADALGTIRTEEFIDLFTAVGQKDVPAILKRIDAAVQRGVDASFYLDKCVEHTRQLMVLKAAPEAHGLLEVPEPIRVRLSEEAQLFSKQDLFYLFSVLAEGVQTAKRLSIKRVALEMTLLKCALREPMTLMDEVIQSSAAQPQTQPQFQSQPAAAATRNNPTAAPRSNPSAAASSRPAQSAPSTSPQAAARVQGAPDPASPSSGPSAEADAGPTAVALDEVWSSVVRRVQTEKMSAASYLKDANPLDHSKDVVIVGFPEKCSFHMEAMSEDANLKLVEKHLSDLLKKETRVKFILHNEGSTGAGKGIGPADAPPQGLSSREIADRNPFLKNAMGIFGGRIIQ